LQGVPLAQLLINDVLGLYNTKSPFLNLIIYN
jgi:hypothetical protein